MAEAAKRLVGGEESCPTRTIERRLYDVCKAHQVPGCPRDDFHCELLQQHWQGSMTTLSWHAGRLNSDHRGLYREDLLTQQVCAQAPCSSRVLLTLPLMVSRHGPGPGWVYAHIQ